MNLIDVLCRVALAIVTVFRVVQHCAMGRSEFEHLTTLQPSRTDRPFSAEHNEYWRILSGYELIVFVKSLQNQSIFFLLFIALYPG